MHGKIFQIERDPIYEDDYIDENFIPEWFVWSIADSVETNEGSERTEAINWLMNSALDSVAYIDGDKLTFNGNINRYFESKFSRFTEKAANLAMASLYDFSHTEKLDSMLDELSQAYSDRFGFYVYDSTEDSILPLDKFMRRVSPGETYYIGGVVDYHY